MKYKLIISGYFCKVGSERKSSIQICTIKDWNSCKTLSYVRRKLLHNTDVLKHGSIQ